MNALAQMRVQVRLHLHDILPHNTSSPIARLVSLPVESNEMTHLSPESHRRMNESLLVRINDRSIPNQVRLLRLDPLSLVNELPDQEQWRNEQLHGVVGEEVGHTPWQV